MADEERDTERDEGRAAGCVSTVRSAMTAVRFLGKGREKEVRAHDACVAKAREKTTECRVSAGRRTTSSR
ncbi:hypothetical protein PC120_g12938 [Phytophthora cactorum]|nr:hypothetical protein PC120_g12938 [Phytophthora cactorum]